MFSFCKSFFSLKRAAAFKADLEAQGIEKVTISTALDGFGQLQYRVEWGY